MLAPFDAELFGHWWFEGPRFLESFIRKVADDRQDLRLTSKDDFGQPIFSSPRQRNFSPTIQHNKQLRRQIRVGERTDIWEFGSTKAIPGSIRIFIQPRGE